MLFRSAVVLGVLALTLLLCTGPLIDLRGQTRAISPFLGFTALLIAFTVSVRGVLYAGLTRLAPNPQSTPLDLLLTTLTLAVIAWLVLDLVERRRFARPRVPVLTNTVAARVTIAAAFLLVGVVDAGLLLGYERLLRRVVADTNLDLLHFSLHPLSSGRLALEFALVRCTRP